MALIVQPYSIGDTQYDEETQDKDGVTHVRHITRVVFMAIGDPDTANFTTIYDMIPGLRIQSQVEAGPAKKYWKITKTYTSYGPWVP
jgi:hypothetical protein